MEEMEVYPGSPRKISSPRKKSSPHKHAESRRVTNSFPVHIQVDRALHLPSIIDQSRLLFILRLLNVNYKRMFCMLIKRTRGQQYQCL